MPNLCRQVPKRAGSRQALCHVPSAWHDESLSLNTFMQKLEV